MNNITVSTRHWQWLAKENGKHVRVDALMPFRRSIHPGGFFFFSSSISRLLCSTLLLVSSPPPILDPVTRWWSAGTQSAPELNAQSNFVWESLTNSIFIQFQLTPQQHLRYGLVPPNATYYKGTYELKT
jgi:hypothetical protein